MATPRPGLLLRGPRHGARWWAGLALIVYGAVGLALLVAAIVGLGRPLEQLGTLGRTVETQRGALTATLRDTSRTLGDASTGFAGFDQSLAQARTSTDRAATLAREVSGTMAGMGRAMNVSVFGVQPLAQLAPQFERAAQQLDQLGTDLQGIGTALNRNSADIRTARADLDRVRAQVERLATAAESTPIPAGTAGELTAVRIGLYGLLGWLALQALAAVVVGLALTRSGGAD